MASKYVYDSLRQYLSPTGKKLFVLLSASGLDPDLVMAVLEVWLSDESLYEIPQYPEEEYEASRSLGET